MGDVPHREVAEPTNSVGEVDRHGLGMCLGHQLRHWHRSGHYAEHPRGH